MSAEIRNMRKQMRKPNIFISGLIECGAEETQYQRIELVKTFFKEKMDISDELKIKDAFRQGLGNPRQMCVIFANLDYKYKVLSNSSKLKGKRNARRHLFYIDEDLIDEEREMRNYMKELRKENFEKDDQDKLKINIRK